jgi:Protein of unknown function (DUF3604)
MKKRRLMMIMVAAIIAVALGGILSRAERESAGEQASGTAPTKVVAVRVPQTVPSNPDRDCFFGQTHSHTSWSVDAYLIGNHLTTPEDAYKYSLGQPIKHPAGFEVQIKGRPLDFHGVTDHSEYAGVTNVGPDLETRRPRGREVT